MNNINTHPETFPVQHPEECEAANEQIRQESLFGLLKYLLIGTMLGIVFVKAEIISWFRIQEMFRMDSFHMYGVIGTAVVTGALSLFILRKTRMRTLVGEEIRLKPKSFHKGVIIGGLVFGLGWALTGACPGPLFTQIGAGFLPVGITLASAVAGTWLYGLLKDKLPH